MCFGYQENLLDNKQGHPIVAVTEELEQGLHRLPGTPRTTYWLP